MFCNDPNLYCISHNCVETVERMIGAKRLALGVGFPWMRYPYLH
jgi:hypothetical protein